MMMKPHARRTGFFGFSFLPALAGLILLSAMMALTGCQAAGVVAHGIAGGDREVQVNAQYKALQGKSVAVLVAADEAMLYRYPHLPKAVSQAVSAQIAASVPGVTMTTPKQITDFQAKNPYWTTLGHARLIQRLGVQRLVYIDVSDFSTHEPGNTYSWQGMIVANVGVVEAESSAPENLSFNTVVRADYPEKSSSMGVLDSNDATIQMGTLQVFARKTAWLFCQHTEIESGK